jgi:hypothetical protein
MEQLAEAASSSHLVMSRTIETHHRLLSNDAWKIRWHFKNFSLLSAFDFNAIFMQFIGCDNHKKVAQFPENLRKT